MAYTPQEVGARIRARNPQAFSGTQFTDEQIGARAIERNPSLQALTVQKAPEAPTSPVQASKPAPASGLAGFATGALKGLGETVAGAQALGEKGLEAITKPVAHTFGQKTLGEIGGTAPLGQRLREQGVFEAQGTAQKFGKGVERVAEFLAPVPGAGKAKALKAVTEAPGFLKGALGLGKAAVREGADVATRAALQKGSIEDVPKDVAIGAAFPVAGAALKKVAAPTAESFINSLIKPLKKDFSFGKNPGRGVASEGITAMNLEDLGTKIAERRSQLGEEIGTVISGAKGKKVSLVGVLSPIDDTLARLKRAPETNGPTIERLEAARRDLLANVGKKLGAVDPQKAFNLKQVVADITKFTGNPSDDKAVNSALKRVYGNIKERINTAIPKLKPLNERFADLKSAEVATKYRDIIEKRQNLIGLAPKIGIYGGVLGSIASGNIPLLATSLAAAGGEKIMSSAFFKTQAAKALMKLAEPERSKILQAFPALMKALGTSITRPQKTESGGE